MSAESRSASLLRLAVAAGLVAAAGAAVAEDETVPGLEFLEYLGSWEETDEDWVWLADVAEPVDDEREDAAESVPTTPDGENLAELDDEE